MERFDRQIWINKTLWKEALWIDECPFCEWNDWELIKKFEKWKLILNKYPYNWINNHLLLIPLEHKEHTKELNNKELLELREVEEHILNYYKWENYFSFIRQTNWWKTVKHLHYHYLPWSLHSWDLEKIMEKQHITSN